MIKKIWIQKSCFKRGSLERKVQSSLLNFLLFLAIPQLKIEIFQLGAMKVDNQITSSALIHFH